MVGYQRFLVRCQSSISSLCRYNIGHTFQSHGTNRIDLCDHCISSSLVGNQLIISSSCSGQSCVVGYLVLLRLGQRRISIFSSFDSCLAAQGYIANAVDLRDHRVGSSLVSNQLIVCRSCSGQSCVVGYQILLILGQICVSCLGSLDSSLAAQSYIVNAVDLRDHRVSSSLISNQLIISSSCSGQGCAIGYQALLHVGQVCVSSLSSHDSGFAIQGHSADSIDLCDHLSSCCLIFGNLLQSCDLSLCSHQYAQLGDVSLLVFCQSGMGSTGSLNISLVFQSQYTHSRQRLNQRIYRLSLLSVKGFLICSFLQSVDFCLCSFQHILVGNILGCFRCQVVISPTGILYCFLIGQLQLANYGQSCDLIDHRLGSSLVGSFLCCNLLQSYQLSLCRLQHILVGNILGNIFSQCIVCFASSFYESLIFQRQHANSRQRCDLVDYDLGSSLIGSFLLSDSLESCDLGFCCFQHVLVGNILGCIFSQSIVCFASSFYQPLIFQRQHANGRQRCDLVDHNLGSSLIGRFLLSSSLESYDFGFCSFQCAKFINTQLCSIIQSSICCANSCHSLLIIQSQYANCRQRCDLSIHLSGSIFNGQSVSNNGVVIVSDRHMCCSISTSATGNRVSNICTAAWKRSAGTCPGIVSSSHQNAINVVLSRNRVGRIHYTINTCIIVKFSADKELIASNEIQSSFFICCIAIFISISVDEVSYIANLIHTNGKRIHFRCTVVQIVGDPNREACGKVTLVQIYATVCKNKVFYQHGENSSCISVSSQIITHRVR